MSYSTAAELSERRGGSIPLDKALKKIYLVKCKGKYAGALVLPKSLRGKRVKLVLVDEIQMPTL